MIPCNFKPGRVACCGWQANIFRNIARIAIPCAFRNAKLFYISFSSSLLSLLALVKTDLVRKCSISHQGEKSLENKISKSEES